MRLSRPVMDLFAIDSDEFGEFVLGMSKEEASDMGSKLELDCMIKHEVCSWFYAYL